jgi:hypothetical protein
MAKGRFSFNAAAVLGCVMFNTMVSLSPYFDPLSFGETGRYGFLLSATKSNLLCKAL